MNLKELKEILQLLDEKEITEFELEEAGDEAPDPQGVGQRPGSSRADGALAGAVQNAPPSPVLAASAAAAPPAAARPRSRRLPPPTRRRRTCWS